jgi:hypothetical protein
MRKWGQRVASIQVHLDTQHDYRVLSHQSRLRVYLIAVANSMNLKNLSMKVAQFSLLLPPLLPLLPPLPFLIHPPPCVPPFLAITQN